MIILASSSPRRKELLALLDIPFTVQPTEVDETLPKGISPKDAVEYLSLMKAKAVSSDDSNIIIGADTVVALGSVILGKPTDKADAKRMLHLLSGKTHSVFTGVTLIKGDKVLTFSAETRVTFFELSDSEISNYVATKEPMDKAGAYGIQGKGSLLAREICGDYFNVVGLPISELNRRIRDF